MNMDTGKWNQDVSDTGVSINTAIDGYAAKQVTVVNTGSAKMFAKANASVDDLLAAVVAGSGAIPIRPGSSMIWTASRIASVALATDNGDVTTADWAAVKEASADPVSVLI